MFETLDVLRLAIGQYTNATIAKLELLYQVLKDHVINDRNPHRVDKFDVGLGKVQNYAPATQKQAIEGKNNNTVVTPKRVEEYMESNIYTPLIQLFDDAIDQLDDR